MTLDRRQLAPREWIERAAHLAALEADPAAAAARLDLLAGRLAAFEAGDLATSDRIEVDARLGAVGRTVRLWHALAAAVESTRPAIEAAERMLEAAGRGCR